MAGNGPVPKRSSERRRQNKESKPEIVKAIVQKVEVPPANPAWHPIALGLYSSLKESGQSRFYEPSDWWMAQYVCDAMSRNLKQRQKFSSVLFASVMSGLNDLLVDEASRRRVRLEVERAADEGDKTPASVTAIAGYRERLAAGAKSG